MFHLEIPAFEGMTVRAGMTFQFRIKNYELGIRNDFHFLGIA